MRDLDIKIGDIPQQHQEFASLVGIDKFIEVCNLFGGASVYIPTIKTLTNHCRKDDIQEMYHQGMSISEIARECKLSNNYIRYILKKSSTVLK